MRFRTPFPFKNVVFGHFRGPQGSKKHRGLREAQVKWETTLVERFRTPFPFKNVVFGHFRGPRGSKKHRGPTKESLCARGGFRVIYI